MLKDPVWNDWLNADTGLLWLYGIRMSSKRQRSSILADS